MPLRLTGLTTGTDWDAIIARLMEVERSQLLPQQRRQASLEQKRDAWRDVESRLTNLQNTIGALRDTATFEAKTATSSNTSLLTASVTSLAQTGSFQIRVDALAKAQSVQSDAFGGSTTALGLSGTIRVGLDGAGANVDISVTAADTLQSIADQINQKSATVQASIIKRSDTDHRLMLTAKNTGLAYAFDGAKTGTVDDVSGGTVLQSLGVRTTVGGPTDTNSNGFKDANELSTAQDATLILNGQTGSPITRSSNTISDLFEGVTLNLVGVNTTENVTVTVNRDTSVAVNAVRAFVDQYNSVVSFIKEKTSKDEATGKVGELFGDATANGILSRLRQLVTGRAAGMTGALDNLGQIGVTTGAYLSPDKDKLLFDSSKLTAQMASSMNDVLELFGAKSINVASALNGGTAAVVSGLTSLGAISDLINGNTSSASWGTAGGGWESTGVPTTVSVAFSKVRTVDQVKIHTLDSATQPAGSAGIKDFNVYYYDASGTRKLLKAVTGNTSGVVTIDFEAVSTSKIEVEVTAANGTPQMARLVEVEVYQRNYGVASQLDGYVQSLTAAKGVTPTAQSNLQSQVDAVKKRLEQLNERIERKQKMLQQQFATLETNLSRLRQQQSWVMAQIGGLGGLV